MGMGGMRVLCHGRSCALGEIGDEFDGLLGG